MMPQTQSGSDDPMQFYHPCGCFCGNENTFAWDPKREEAEIAPGCSNLLLQGVCKNICPDIPFRRPHMMEGHTAPKSCVET